MNQDNTLESTASFQLGALEASLASLPEKISEMRRLRTCSEREARCTSMIEIYSRVPYCEKVERATRR